MPIVGNAIICWINSDPPIKWNTYFYPCMRGAFATEFLIFWANITAYVSCRNSNHTKHDQKYMSKILAYACFQLPYFTSPGFHCSNTFSTVSYTHLRAHETPEQLVCRLL